MKLLLTRTVEHLGIVGDVVEVAPGYARNYLLPRRMATAPTESNMRAVAEARRQAELELAKERALLEGLAKRLEGVEVTIRARANEAGVLYGSVGKREIADALGEEGFGIAPDKVVLRDPLRQLDKFEVVIRLAEDLKPEIKVWVVREKSEDEAETEETEGATEEASANDDAAGD